MASSKTDTHNESDRIDRVYRYAMLVTGILAAVLFLGSLVALVEFPGAFSYMAIGMVAIAVIFLVLRTIYRFRNTFRVKR